MKSFTLQATKQNQQTSVLPKGKIKISTAVPVYYTIGNDPIVDPTNSALIKANTTIEIRIPVKCLKLAIMAVKDSGKVSVTELTGGASSSCSL